MKFISSRELNVTSADDFIYDYLLKLFKQIRLVQSGSSLDATLRRHPRLKNYCIAKQIDMINSVESTYFNEDGSLISEAVSNYQIKLRSLQNKSN